MSVRLSGDARGDPLDSPPHAREIEKKSEIETERDESHPEISKNPRIHPPHHPNPNFIPRDFRERAREIIKKSQNPRKISAYFHSKAAIFLSQSTRIVHPYPPLEEDRCRSVSPTPAPPALPLFVPESAPLSLVPALPTPPLIKQSQDPRCVTGDFATLIPYQPVSNVSEGRMADTAPLPIDSPVFRQSNPDLDDRQPVAAFSGQEIKDQSLARTFNRFYAGSNHRIKWLMVAHTNPPCGALSLTIHLLTPTQPHTSTPRPCGLWWSHSSAMAARNAANSAGALGSKNGNNISNSVVSLGVPMASTTNNGDTASRRLKGKEIVKELGTEKEKMAVVVNMSRARGAAQNRFIAVGIFLSILAVSSKTLIDNMKKLWRIRGHMDVNQLLDRRFVLEFSEEGDFLHVTRGGPWRFRNDAVLVDELKEGDDPETVKFTTIPIWTQFRNIPFYLLSKELARKLGKHIGQFIAIDNNARGDICDKFIRARVRLPIDQALQRWIPLEDEFTDEVVIASVMYERLPNFCLFCGMIGHQTTECKLPAEDRIEQYNVGLGVPPTHPEDPRCWYLPEITGQACQPQPVPWRAMQDGQVRYPSQGRHRQAATVAHVAQEVGKLSIKEKSSTNTSGEGDENTSPPAPPTTQPDTSQVLQDALHKAGTVDSVGTALAAASTVVNGSSHAENDDLPLKKALPRWKRVPREEGKEKETLALTTQGGALGAPRSRPRPEEDDNNLQPKTKKKIIIPVPSLEECLGAENLRKLMEEENLPLARRRTDKQQATAVYQEEEGSDSFVLITGQIQDHAGSDTEESKRNDEQPTGSREEGVMPEGRVEGTEKEAASPGAAGKLTGAEDRAGQEQ